MHDEVVIVGGGPSGAAAAYRLARAGARVTVFDASHPREKPCGGGVTGRALALVADALDTKRLSKTTIRSARFLDSPRGASAIVPLSASDDDADAGLIVTSRESFDAALLDAAVRAGATLERARVLDVRVTGASVTLTTSRGDRHADVVLGADGANSLVRRRVTRAFRRDQLSIATGFFAHGATSDEIVIEMAADPPGYIWSFPRPDHLAIGICGQADAGTGAGALRAVTAAWIAATGIAVTARLEPYSWPIPSLKGQDFDRLTVAGPRWMLLGDAAGLVDPITREGIFFALASGHWAADALLAHAGADAYRARVADEATAELRRAARFKEGFFRPAFNGLLIRALQESPAIRAVMADLIAGRQSYATLKARLLRTFEWRLAARTLWGATLGTR
jgi:geranylgeranyl reductase family protein